MGDFIKGLLPVEEKEDRFSASYFRKIHEASDCVDGIGGRAMFAESILRFLEVGINDRGDAVV